ncbi:plasmid replication protein RepC [Shinella kummerowiae]|uniref:plasmid replication protein RepC n=1 Tax=Shinella kummerowiae TaxID=417745 RepID=UPI0021B57856|nr:plasmid replication protein RepC [Shinella kummerowiae]MCT7667519.1 plasmid replication protein RepC [Shinella kummerowiae]
MTQSGWRKPTPGLCKANGLAKDGEQLAVPKNQAMLALRRVAHVIGLKPGDLMLLETLAVFTKSCDWETGARPIVWPSNDYLIESTGYSLSAVKRHLRRLSEAGLIAYRDSSNGKRWGHRDKDGRIIEAYGFDLSPLAARTGEFEALHAALQAERNQVKDLRRGITILRRTVAALLDSDPAGRADAFWRGIGQRYDALLAALRQGARDTVALSRLHQSFKLLRDDAEEALRKIAETPAEAASEAVEANRNPANMNPTGAVSAPHIRITNDIQPVNRNGMDHATETPVANERPTEGMRASAAGAKSGASRVERQPVRAPGELSIRSILYACPAFADMAHGIAGHINSWRDLVAVADRIRPIIGISEDAWAVAQRAMSREEAAAALALITDKYSDGVVSSPGGYLRGLALKAKSGELHLARSVFGRFQERQGASSGRDKPASHERTAQPA